MAKAFVLLNAAFDQYRNKTWYIPPSEFLSLKIRVLFLNSSEEWELRLLGVSVSNRAISMLLICWLHFIWLHSSCNRWIRHCSAVNDELWCQWQIKWDRYWQSFGSLTRHFLFLDGISFRRFTRLKSSQFQIFMGHSVPCCLNETIRHSMSKWMTTMPIVVVIEYGTDV